jgi:hypothetical protein
MSKNSVKEKPPPPELEKFELSLNSDTAIIYSDKTIQYNFRTSGLDIEYIKFKLDGKEIAVKEAKYGQVTINKYSWLDFGLHSLSVEIYTDAGTGSIADQLGAENYVMKHTWALIYKETPSEHVKYSVNRGLLNLSWAEYKGDGFDEYIVYRYIQGKYYEILRTTTEECVLKSYVGEGAVYRIMVNQKIEGNQYWGKIEVPMDIPYVNLTVNDSQQFKFYYEKPTYYAAVKKIEIRQSKNYFFDTSSVRDILDMNDTVFTNKTLPFGITVKTKLTLIPDGNNIAYENGETFYTINSSEYSVPFDDGYANIDLLSKVNDEEFVYVKNDSIIRYSLTNNRKVDKMAHRHVDSDLGQFTANHNQLSFFIPNLNKFFITQTHNLQSYNVYDMDDIEGKTFGPYYFAVSGEGTIARTELDTGFSIYNYKENKRLGHYSASGEKLKIKMSLNGEYIIVCDDNCNLVSFNNGEFTMIGGFSEKANIQFFEFDGTNRDWVVFEKNDKFIVKRCVDFTTVNEFSLHNEKVLDVDFGNKEILTQNDKELYIRDYPSGDLLNKISIASEYPSYYLVNRTIVSSDGSLFYLDENI